MSAGVVRDLTWPLSGLEIAAGGALEPLRKSWVGRAEQCGPSAREVLEDQIRESLSSGRASVSFSGGRDSSLILALACHVARKYSLPPPVAITMRHPSPESREDEWQERMVSHLKLQDWVRVEVGDSLDALGPVATALLVEHGIQAPSNAYMHLAVAKVAPSGTLLTGIGGDEILGTSGSRLARVVYGSQRPHARDGLSALLALTPDAARWQWKARRGVPWAPWLRPSAARRIARRICSANTAARVRWDVDVVTFGRSRTAQLGRSALAAVGGVHGIRISSPLLSERFIDAMGRQFGPVGPRSRTRATDALGGDLLPAEVVRRPTKAGFGALVFGPDARRLGASIAADLGEEVEQHVDLDAVRREWTAEHPHPSTLMMLQHAWLRDRAQREASASIRSAVASS